MVSNSGIFGGYKSLKTKLEKNNIQSYDHLNPYFGSLCKWGNLFKGGKKFHQE